ncbi:MAG: Na+/H+ antiporter NhaC [Synergistaceae bacterium]|nr:Na+/H+ antiporter NhaC [Synergistaceae bacterium]
MEAKSSRKPTFGEALLVLVIDSIIISYGVLDIHFESGATFGLGLSAHIPLFLAAIFTAVVGVFFIGRKWADVEEGMINGITIALQAVLILLTIGGLVGAWIQSGVVPTLIYYGLNLLTPEYFLLASLLICSIVSLSTGSSWSTSGTVGIALMGIGAGLGVPAPVTAGFIISGAYFGDKMSPLSDTTNLAPAVAGSDLFSHIRAMMWTTVPTLLIVAVIAAYMGREYSGALLDGSRISIIQQIMAAEFSISWMGFMPPLLVLLLAVLKVPAIPGIVSGMLLAVVMSLFQGTELASVLDALQGGYVPGLIAEMAESADAAALNELLGGAAVFGAEIFDAVKDIAAMLNDLLARGGLDGMLDTVALILVALVLGGIMETCGFLEVLLEKLLEKVKSLFGLVGAVTFSCIFTNLFLGDQYLALVMPGRLFRPAFEDYEKDGRKVDARLLSRVLEDSGTLTSVLVPWNTCGAYNSGVLGVPTLSYLPYAFLNYLNFIVALVMTKLGLGIPWIDGDAEAGASE